ncbi:MAG: 3-dehydro-L-gulonate 2-dehydrogenase [Spirochaetales bacterium]|nr:3-dehydro-L-gulonate 2-dehydrogenase [Spirochaetales bacterium]
MAVNTIKIRYAEMKKLLRSLLSKYGFSEGKAEVCAEVITQSTCDGVVSHGLARVPRLVRQVLEGGIDIHAEPELVRQSGASEYWDGKHGIGIWNAVHATERVTTLALEHGLALVSLRNNSHWMRAGSYGWQAADRGCALICWTNTIPNMPPWDSDKPLIGNNPLVIAVPNPDGHLVLDMAMSQFSFGKLDLYRREGAELPVPGGFDRNGTPTSNPAEILETGLPLPAGYWKGSALTVILDILTASLAEGSATAGISAVENETCQTFIAVAMNNAQITHTQKLVRQLAAQFAGAAGPAGKTPRYPGQNIPDLRKENLKKGIPVPAALWEKVNSL